MDVLAAIGGVSTLAMAIVAWALWQRSKGLKSEIESEQILRVIAEDKLTDATKEFDDYRSRAKAKETSLVLQLEHYENHELDAIEEEPNRNVRIARRRSWVASVLSQASATSDDDGA